MSHPTRPTLPALPGSRIITRSELAALRPARVVTVHPTLAHIARTRPGYTRATIDGRPVRIYLERDRIRWGRLAALTAAIVAPIGGMLVVAAYALGVLVAWLVAHWLLIVGGLALLAVASLLARVGVCCPGIHCGGCRHR